MTETIFGVITKSDTKVIRITRDIDDRDRLRVRVREWYRDGAGSWWPGRDGIDIRHDDVAAFIGAVLNASKKRGAQ